MLENKRRFDFIDMAKGYGILFIMIGHLGVFKLSALFSFHVWIYSFHIPLFFFLSGFLFNPDLPLKEFFAKKIRSILIPYFCTGVIIIIYEIYEAATRANLSWKFVGEEFLALLIQRRTWTIWFLAALLIINIILYFLKKLVRKDGVLLIITFALAALGVLYYQWGGDKLPWDIDVAVPALPFFFSGYMIKKHIDFFRSKLKEKKTSVLLFIACLALSVIGSMIQYNSTKVIPICSE